jgi:AraC family transcriptional regulator
MDPVQKAIWFVEGHLNQDFVLDDVADVAGLSRFHLVRAFGQVTGRSVMRYVRARRLSEAARGLAAGAPDILSLALDAGYGSHEAFTRAFREQFGRTPEQVRSQGCVGKLALVEPIKLDHLTAIKLAPPALIDRGPFLLAGLLEHYRDGDMSAIPNQWQRFAPWLGNIPGQVAHVTYGVVCNGDDDGMTDYFTATEVSDFGDLPAELSRMRMPAQRYAVFSHAGHISEIQSVWRTIWAEWVPQQVKKLADAPFFERYPEAFDPISGTGGFEIWLPVER